MSQTYHEASEMFNVDNQASGLEMSHKSMGMHPEKGTYHTTPQGRVLRDIFFQLHLIIALRAK